MAASTRPLTLGEILDRTVELYRRNFLLYAGISSLPSAVMVLAVGGAALLLSSQFASLKPTGNEAGILIAVVIILGLLIGVPILIAAFSLSLGASNFAVLKTHGGEKVTIRASYIYAFKHFWRHVGILLMQVLLAWIVPYMVFVAILAVGSILTALMAKSGAGNEIQVVLVWILVLFIVVFLAACFLIWVRFSLAFAATVAEDKKVWPSMQRSAQLTKGSRWRIFVMFLMLFFLSLTIDAALLLPVFIILSLVFQKALTGPAPPTLYIILLQTANLAVSFLVRAFVTPIYSSALVLFYYDQRIRQEGYDIELLMERAGWAEIPPPAPPPMRQPILAQTPSGPTDPAAGYPAPAYPAPGYPAVQLPPMPAVLVPPPPAMQSPLPPPPPPGHHAGDGGLAAGTDSPQYASQSTEVVSVLAPEQETARSESAREAADA